MALQQHGIPFVETHVEEMGVKITQVCSPPSIQPWNIFVAFGDKLVWSAFRVCFRPPT